MAILTRRPLSEHYTQVNICFLLVLVTVIFFRHSFQLSPYNPYIRGKGKQQTLSIEKNTQSLKNS